MNSLKTISFVCADDPIDFELQDHGRVLVIKDALYAPSTKKYHDIKLIQGGWSLFGFHLGGGGTFNGITADMAREIRTTYGIVLKTLDSEPNGIAFWGDETQTSYFKASDAAAKINSVWRWMEEIKTSYPDGYKKDDLFLSPEDAAHFGAERMTVHDAINAGIWNRIERINGKVLSPGGNKAMDGARQEKTQESAKLLPSENAQDARSRSATAQKPKTTTSKSSGASSGKDGTKAPFSNAEAQWEESIGKRQSQSAARKEGMDQQIKSLPSIPVYRVKSTPIELGYDNAPFEERKRRVIAHLDSSSPIPFSAFVDHNRDQRIHPSLFRKMLEALRRLSENPEANDPDAKYMKELFTHWFRAAYHYLDKNSKPGDGYQQVVNKISEEVKDAAKAEQKAKEIYWRRHATDFWMTLVDLFASEKIDIDPFHKFLSSSTSLNSWL